MIAGASGCGKTTLVRAINGLIPRSYKGERTGKILVFGEETAVETLADLAKSRHGAAGPRAANPGHKGAERSRLGLENLGLPRSEIIERVDEALALLKIEGLRDPLTFLLSGGEKQKVALGGRARDAAQHPLAG